MTYDELYKKLDAANVNLQKYEPLIKQHESSISIYKYYILQNTRTNRPFTTLKVTTDKRDKKSRVMVVRRGSNGKPEFDFVDFDVESKQDWEWLVRTLVDSVKGLEV